MGFQGFCGECGRVSDVFGQGVTKGGSSDGEGPVPPGLVFSPGGGDTRHQPISGADGSMTAEEVSEVGARLWRAFDTMVGSLKWMC